MCYNYIFKPKYKYTSKLQLLLFIAVAVCGAGALKKRFCMTVLNHWIDWLNSLFIECQTKKISCIKCRLLLPHYL